MDGPLCKSLYMYQNFFDKKDFDSNNNPNYPTFFCWLILFFTLTTMKT